MPIPEELFEKSTPISRDAAGDAAGVNVAWLDIPAKGAVYLLVAVENEQEMPVLLATVGDLRAALKRRLLEAPADTRTKRVKYNEICTRIYWRQVDSSFAANWWYWRAARTLFPETYKALVPWRSSWWVAVEREGPFPKLRRTTDLSDGTLLYAGPVRDKHMTGKLIETVEDLFDLCRYHAELVQAPHGRACAYKEMGKCPAPCDGSVPIPWYRQQMNRAWAFLTGRTRETWLAENETAMRAAAARQEFETANRLKQRLARAATIEGKVAGRGEAFGFVRELEQFSFVAVQPGRGKRQAEIWLVHGGNVQCAGSLNHKNIALRAGELAAQFQALAVLPPAAPLNAAQTEQIGIVCHHLFRGEDDGGIYVRGEEVLRMESRAIEAAAEALWARKAAAKPLVEQASDGEGIAISETKPDEPPLPLSPETAAS